MARKVEVDNRGLEPPEPMVRILEALEKLGPDDILVAINDRRPFFLYPQLDERGFIHRTEEREDGSFEITISRGGGKQGEHRG